LILAIDQGTTGCTCLVFDAHAVPAGRAQREFAQHFPQPGWVEHDLREIWEVTRAVAGEALADAGVQPGALTAVGIANQRETVCVWDPATGEPLHRAIVWQDRRTAARCQQLRDAGHEPLIRQRTGLVLDPYFSATKIDWLLRNVDGLRARARDGRAVFGTIDSWLIYNLTGEHVSDPSNASRTLLYDIRARRWDPDLLALFDIPPRSLPRVCPSAGELGVTRSDALHGHAVPVTGVAGDQQAALFGQACLEPGMGKNTYGTGSFVLLNAGATPPPPAPGLLSTVAWEIGAGAEAGWAGGGAETAAAGAVSEPAFTYALEASIFVTGAAVQWLRDGLGLIAHAAETEALAASLAANDGVYFVPALTGLGSPHWDPHARGTIVGLTRGATRAHLARATLEAIAYQTLDAVRAMEAAAGLALGELRVDGGATANAWLMQFQADILGVPVLVADMAETTALGAAGLAGVGAGLWGVADWADRVRARVPARADGVHEPLPAGADCVRAVGPAVEPTHARGRRFEPNMDDDDRARLLAGWHAALARAHSASAAP
jgi:glycerol kinase